MTLRALGMHADALTDVETHDYRPAAQTLLEQCFERKLAAFC